MKTIWIIDGSYIHKASHGTMDYLKFKQKLEECNNGDFFETYFLDSTTDSPSQGEIDFYTWLKAAPPDGPQMRVQLYDLKTMQVNCPDCGKTFERHVQKGVDVGIATLMLRLATQNVCERLILSAGDGDFEDAIDYVKSNLHKEVWICGFRNTVSTDLQSYANKVIWIEDFGDEVRRDNERRRENSDRQNGQKNHSKHAHNHRHGGDQHHEHEHERTQREHHKSHGQRAQQ